MEYRAWVDPWCRGASGLERDFLLEFESIEHEARAVRDGVQRAETAGGLARSGAVEQIVVGSHLCREDAVALAFETPGSKARLDVESVVHRIGRRPTKCSRDPLEDQGIVDIDSNVILIELDHQVSNRSEHGFPPVNAQ